MTVREALQTGSARLKQSETPFLDAGLLLASVLGMSREKLLASYPDRLTEKQFADYLLLIEKRKTGIPVSYLLNRKEFFGRTFFVDERVLIPRPDTEILVESALEIIGRYNKPLRLLDVCTGTGCIPLTLALETENTGKTIEFFAGELSPGAMDVFEINKVQLGNPPVHLRQSNLLSGFNEKFDIITANPPYLTRAETAGMKDSGWPEPALALDGGEDGLDLVRELIHQSIGKLNQEGWLLIEAAWDQMETIRTLLDESGFLETGIIRDLAGRNRVVRGSLNTPLT